MDTFWSVELWGGKSLKVRKSHQDAPLSGIGWISLGEYDTRDEARAAAKRARGMLEAGETEDAVMVAFGQ